MGEDMEQVDTTDFPITEGDKPATEIASMTLAKQIAAYKIQVADIAAALQQATAENAAMAKELATAKADLQAVADAKAEVQTQLAEQVKAAAGYDATIADLQKAIAAQKQQLNLSAFEDVKAGTEPVKVLYGEGKTLLQTYKGLNGQARFDFFKANEKDLMKELRR